MLSRAIELTAFAMKTLFLYKSIYKIGGYRLIDYTKKQCRVLEIRLGCLTKTLCYYSFYKNLCICVYDIDTSI